jgi:hypothetical protein
MFSYFHSSAIILRVRVPYHNNDSNSYSGKVTQNDRYEFPDKKLDKTWISCRYLLTAARGHVSQILDGVSKGFEVAHECLVTLQQSFGGVFVLAEVDVSGQRFLFFKPRLGLVGVGKVLVSLEGIFQILLSLDRLLLQLIPVVVELAEPGLDVVGGKVAFLDHVLSRLRDGIDPRLVVVDLHLHGLMLLDQVLEYTS